MMDAPMKRPLRVLIVDDSPDDIELLLNALGQSGYEIEYEAVDTPGAMRAALVRQEWDVITSDHAMPHFSAPEALALAAELRADVPFVIVSGEIDLNLAVCLMKKGALDYIQKRELNRVAPAIERVLREAELHRDRERINQELELSEARYRKLFETSRDGILIFDADTEQIIDANPFSTDMLGCSREDLVGRKWREIGACANPDDSMIAFTELCEKGQIPRRSVSLATRNGCRLCAEYVANVYSINQTRVIQCNIRDVTGRSHDTEDVKQIADYDSLTGLPNRLLFSDRLEQALNIARRDNHQVSLLCVDLGRVRAANDAPGGATGDDILKGAASRIQRHVRKSDTVARLGAEEFAVILPRVEGQRSAATVARKIIDALASGLPELGGDQNDARGGPSIGISMFPTSATDRDALLKSADAALNNAKQSREHFCFAAA